MQMGMIGMGRMGANMVRRLMRAGHECFAFDRDLQQASAVVGANARTCLGDLVSSLDAPRVLWLMVPAGAVDETLAALVPLIGPGDIVVDGGNSHYQDDLRRAELLAAEGLHLVDVGTSGGVWGLERGYCLMIGGDFAPVQHLEPLFAALAPGADSVPATPGRERGRDNPGTAHRGYLHCGPPGAGHFVKMVHNGIEYGLMAAYAEGFNILRQANIGSAEAGLADAETTPLRHPSHLQYDIDVGEVAELWRRGSVISSWLLDLSAQAFLDSPDLAEFTGAVSDSGEGRWTVQTAVEQGVPTPVLSAALYSRFASRGNDIFAGKVLSALRSKFGGHAEKSRKGDAPKDG